MTVAATNGIFTNIATDSSAWGWWAAFGALVVVGAALQYYLSRSQSEPDQTPVVAAFGAGCQARHLPP